MFSDGFRDQPVIGGDKMRLDRGLRPRPALEQAALDQYQIARLRGAAIV